MIMHQVLIKPNQGATESQLEDLCTNVKMLDGIPEVVSAKATPNMARENNGGYTHCLFLTFRRQEDIIPYLANPIHREFVERFVLPIKDNSIAVDYEI